MKHHAIPPNRLLYLMLLVVILLVYWAMHAGALKISLLDYTHDKIMWHVWFNIRLPRILLAIMVGSALATAGALMQGLFRNPLADAGLLGVSSGGALCVALMIILPWSLPAIFLPYGLILAAFIGSLLVCLVVQLLAHATHHSPTRLILLGIAINAICGAATGVLSYISSDQQLRQFSLWTMGYLGQAQWNTLLISTVIILPTLLLSCLLARRLNLLQLGEEDAHYMGVNVPRTQQQLLLLTALLVGSSVAVSGVIGFIGLVIPHLMRLHLGADHRWLLPGSMLAGAALLILADTLARTLITPAEIPVGLFTSLLGGPYFLWLLLQKRGK